MIWVCCPYFCEKITVINYLRVTWAKNVRLRIILCPPPPLPPPPPQIITTHVYSNYYSWKEGRGWKSVKQTN